MRMNKFLLASGSSLAISTAMACAAVLGFSSPAYAVCATPVVADTTISGASTCLDWQGGNILITSDGVVSGTEQAILNTASTLGTIVNSGTINGAAIGISNAGTIDFINVSVGTIDVTDSAIYNNGGDIGTISIRGSASGDSYGIHNNGGNIGTIIGVTEISGGVSGVYNQTGTIGELLANGIIEGATYGVDIAGGEISVITSTGMISGDDTAIRVMGSVSSLNNASGVIGGYLAGVSVGGTGIVDYIGNGIDAITYGDTAIKVEGSVGSIDNDGSIYSSGVVVGDLIAMYNSGSIGALDNSGEISSAFGGGLHNDSGTVTSINNSGAIETFTTAIWNQGGEIGTLVNSGEIISSAGSSAILNAALGSIGTISNSGTIACTGDACWDGISNADGSTITQITNAGQIVGVFTAINNADNGIIGTINNSGLIRAMEGDALSLGADATISAIINSGTIMGETAINNFGTISNAIENGGSIIGGIFADDSTLEFTGGSDSAYGLLTGMGGSVGTIRAEGIIFDVNAYQVLNSNVTVTAAVTNDGTIRINRPITVTGAYIQAPSAALVIGVTNATTYGKLTVSGVTTLTNSSIRLVPINPRSLSNTSYTIVAGGGFTDYTGVSVEATGYTVATATVDTPDYDYLVVTLSGGPVYWDTTNTTGVTADVSTALDRIQTVVDGGGMADFQPILDTISDLTSSSEEEGNAAIRQLAPNQVTPQSVSVGATTQQAVNVVGRRQDFLVRQGRSSSGASNTMRRSSRRGRSSGSLYQSGTFWVQASGGTASHDGGADGYDQDFYGVTFGADTRIGSNMFIGEAVSWMRSSASGTGGSAGSNIDLNSVQLTTYGTYRDGPAYLEGLVNFAFDFYDGTRNIAFLGSTAKADYTGMQYMGRIEAGWDFPISMGARASSQPTRQKAYLSGRAPRIMTFTPIAGLMVGRTDVDGYTETGAGAANLTVSSQSIDTVATSIGAKVSSTYYTSWAKIIPEAKLVWEHNFADDAITTTASLGSVSFTTHGTRVSSDGAKLAVGTTFTRDDRLSASIQYDGDYRSGYSSHSGALKIKWAY